MRSAIGVMFALVLLGSSAAVADQCGVCHPENRVAFESSIHFKEEVTCSDCHGGNPEALDYEEAHRRGFRTLANRQATPAMCAECHSDHEKMRPYNLPVDQHVIYKTSHHGIAVEKGDVRAAICTDCHGTHEIRRVDDPESPVYAVNVAATCGKCHGDETLMAEYGMDAGIPEAYLSSVHGRALFEKRNLAAPTCASCHGFHGATPPGIGDIDKVCGACHAESRAAFLGGPHFEAMETTGLPECASCHSSHEIRSFDSSDVKSLCSECHEGSSPQVEVGHRIEVLFDSAAEEVRSADALAREAGRIPLDVEHHLGRLEDARTHLTTAVPLVHRVSFDDVEQVTRRARSIGEEVQHDLYVQLDRRGAYLGLVVFWFYVLMTLAIFWVDKRRHNRDKKKP